MMIIDGKKVSEAVRSEIKAETAEFIKNTGVQPGLAVIIVGNNPASEIYVRNKIKATEEAGMKSFCYRLSEDAAEEELRSLIQNLNTDRSVHGILVQLPLPKHMDEKRVLSLIDVKKDVDGFSAYQMGKLVLGTPELIACTPHGVMELLHYYDIPIAGKRAVVIGRSNIVGKPMAQLLMAENATVTVCHSRTQNLAEVVREGDIVVAAIGKAEFITEDMIKDGAVVIDVGMNRTDKGLKGDVNFAEVSKKASFITPVPGGVGPMTITMLLKNTLKAAAGI